MTGSQSSERVDILPPSIAFVVLVGRPVLAVATISDLLRHSSTARSSPIFAFYFPGSLSKSEVEKLEALSPNVSVRHTSILLPRYAGSEMFFNRKSSYARRFGRSRIGYLDMCFWTANFFWENSLEGFEYILRFDDDSDLLGSPDAYILAAIAEKDWVVASAGLKDQVSRRHLETSEHFFPFVSEVVTKLRIIPADSQLDEVLVAGDEEAFHRLPRTLGNFNLYRAAAFRNEKWFQWMYAVNLFGGFHRYRWVDIIVIGTFARLHFTNSHRNLGMVDDGVYRQNKPGSYPIRRGIVGVLQRTYHSVRFPTS